MIYSARNTQSKKSDNFFNNKLAFIKPQKIKKPIKRQKQISSPKLPYFNIILWAKNPIYLKSIIKTIVVQHFQDFKVLIAHGISKNLPPHPKVEYIFLQENNKRIIYQTLLTKIHSGYIIWLEPDEKFIHRNILTKIKQHLTNQRVIVYPAQNILQFCVFYQYKQLFMLESDILIKQFIQHYKLQPVQIPQLIKKLTPVELYPDLFHKYILGISTPYKPLIYSIINEDIPFDKTIVAHLHCHNIDMFFNVYEGILKVLHKHFKIIVTFSTGTKIPKELTCLFIDNRGMDIGSKFCVVDYLLDKDYTHILFLHSKSNSEKQALYFSPLIDNLKEIIDKREEYDGVFPDMKWEINGEISRNKKYGEIHEVNHLYRNQLLDYLEIQDRKKEFIEGNVYFLTRKVSEWIFNDLALYNILNHPIDFDYNYMIKKYGLRGEPKELFQQFGQIEIQPEENYGNIEQSFERIVLNCCKRSRIIEKVKEKICIIYVYYERKNEQKNQTNLAFFIKYGLDKSRWKDMDITTLLIINGSQCEVMIPERDDIIVWKRDHNGEYDIGSYRLGIEYLEQKYNKLFYKIFNYLFIMNAGISGPIYNEDKMKHWLDPFLNKMKTENSVICSPVINFLKHTDSGGPGPRCQTYCSLIKINKDIYNLLLYTKIKNHSEKTTNTSIPIHEDYILTTHINKSNTILIGEYGLTRILLNNKYNISCLIYNNINYFDETIWNTFSDRVDRYNHYNPEYFNKTIFIKNNWIVNDEIKDSLPVMYNDTISFINKYIKYENIYQNILVKFNIDYDSLNIPDIIRIENSSNETNKIVTSSKKESYYTFGYSQEIISWPKQFTDNKAVVIYCHYDKDNIVKDYIIQSLKTLIILKYDIIFCTTSKCINNVDLPFKVNYYNNKNILKKGKDIFIYYDVLKKIKIKKYTWITFLNDSILLPIHGIDNMKLTIKKYRKNNDFWGLYLSNESEIHLCSCHMEFNIKCIDKLIIFLKISLNYNFKNTRDIIERIELKILKYLSVYGFKYDGVVKYYQLTPEKHSILFNPVNINKYLNNKEVFGIKWKYIGNYINFNKLDNYYLNYLMRFLKISNSKIPEIPNYF